MLLYYYYDGPPRPENVRKLNRKREWFAIESIAQDGDADSLDKIQQIPETLVETIDNEAK